MLLDWSSGALAEGLECYGTGKHFEAHEHWESVWLKSEEPEKTSTTLTQNEQISTMTEKAAMGFSDAAIDEGRL